MALKLLAIGCVKYGTKICGYRLIDYNDAVNVTEQNHQIKYLDLTSDSIMEAMRNNQVTVDNLAIINGELKGSNGQASRYGAVDAKTKQARKQVMVIVGEVRDKTGTLVGYICSDTDGRIARLLADQAIAQAGRLGLANGKLVDNGKGSRHISAISGGYSVLKLNYEYKVKAVKQDAKPATRTEQKHEQKSANTQAANKSQKTDEITTSQIYEKAIKTIVELEKYKEFKGDFSYKIASSVKRWRKCSEKQYAILEKTLENFRSKCKIEAEQSTEGHKSDGIAVDSDGIKVDTIDDKVVGTVANESKEEKPIKKLRNTSILASGIKPVEIEDIPEKRDNAENHDTDAQQPIDETPINAESDHDADTSGIPQETDVPKVSLSDILKQYKVPNSRLNIPVSDLSIFDFGIINNEIYIRGFKDGIDVPDDVIMPDTVMFKGKEQPVVGIAIDAFKNKEMVNVKTGRYIRDIGAGAFYNCKHLEVLDLSASQHSMIPANMAYCCKNLRSVHLGNRVDRIHELAFYGCRYLVSVDGNKSIDTIARQAFAFCDRLAVFKPMPKFVNEGAFEDCYSLSESGFSFKNIASIGTKGLKGTGFRNLVLPGNVKSVGRKAFADCALLNTVVIEEGVEFVDMYCFAKSKDNCGGNIRTYILMGMTENESYFDLEVIDTPKSLKDVGNDAFRHALLVKVFTGSASESVCIGFNVPYERKDLVNAENATKVRQRANLMGVDPIKMLFRHLHEYSDGVSNPEFIVDESSLLNAKLTPSHFTWLKFKTPADKAIEPHIKFKAALKYAMDLADPFTMPLTPNVLRFSDIIKIETTELFGDGWNEIYKTTFFKRDTLESGSFITFMQGDTLVYIVEASSALDMELTPDAYDDRKIPIKDHLHAGDKIGNDSTIDGRDAARYIYENEDGYKMRANVGLEFFNRIKENSIMIRATRTTYVYYVPATGFALVLFDSRKDKDESYYRNNNKYTYFTVTKILDYAELIKFIASDKNLKTKNGESYTFFYNLSQISQSEASRIIADVKYVAEESCDTLFDAGLQCEAMLKSKNMQSHDMKPDMLTYDMFVTLTESYWMVEKDLGWYESISAKTLNKTNEYTIGSFTVIEYRSNQVVKFNNPYMHGKKNSMIFVMKRGNQIFGVYASIYNLETIAGMLASLTYMPEGYRENAPQLMTKADKIDEVDPKYFYHFYEVLQTTGGWDLQKSFGGYISSFLYCLKSSYHLSMYKPTGVFYLTMDTYVVHDEKDTKTGKKIEKKLNKVTYPIFPIGDMDRALMVADTTNTNNRYARFKEELVQLAIYEKAMRVNKSYSRSKDFPDIDPTNYYIVRQMSMDGIKETFEYSKYVDDRAAFMIGRVHIGALKVHGVNTEDDYELEDDYEVVDNNDMYEDDETDDQYNAGNVELPDGFSEDDFADFDDDDPYFSSSDDDGEED